MVVLTIISTLIFSIYTGISEGKTGKLPKSLSETYYLWPKWVFPIIMLLIAITLLPVWLELLEGSNFQFLSFITCASIIFVGCAADFKSDKLEYRVHSIAAYLAAIASIIAIIFALGTWEFLISSFITVFGLNLLFNKNIKNSYLYCIEYSLFLSIYVSILTKLL